MGGGGLDVDASGKDDGKSIQGPMLFSHVVSERQLT